MKVYLDRNHCEIYQAGCESCFGGRVEVFFGENKYAPGWDVAGCVMKIDEEDKKDTITFFMKDRDGQDKVLDVNQENWPDAYQSWMQLYEKQQAEG
jgi:hypothetical protein